MQGREHSNGGFPRGGWRSVGSFEVDGWEPVYLSALGRVPYSNDRQETVRVELCPGHWTVTLWETPADGRVYDVRVAPTERVVAGWDVDDVVIEPVDEGLRLLGWVEVGEQPRPPGVAVVLGRVADRFPVVPDVDDATPAQVIGYWERAERVSSRFTQAVAARAGSVDAAGAWASRSAVGQFPVVARFRDGLVDEVRVSILPARVR